MGMGLFIAPTKRKAGETMAREEVLQRETLYKHKLGTRATGLNSN
jgi:hypothetical protein